MRSYDYIIQSHGKREIIKSYPISKDKKYLNFILEGTFTDELGNYGIWYNASAFTLQNNNDINLQGYGKRIFQSNEITYIKGYRNKQKQQAGDGKTEVVNAFRPLMPLVGMSCTYALNFYEDNTYSIHKCTISEKQKDILSNISKKKE